MKREILMIIGLSFILTINSFAIPADKIEKRIFLTDKNIDGNIINIINEIDEDLVFGYLEELVSYGPRFTGSPNCSRAGIYLYHEFKKMGLVTEFHEWEFGGFSGNNIIGTLQGTDKLNDAVIIISAHYDTTRGSLGANDDGSGVAAILAIAKVISQYTFNQTIRFIAFSGEEVGTFGSFCYARDTYKNGENIYAVLNIDIIGWAETEYGGNILRFSIVDRTKWIAEFASDVSDKYYDLINIKIETIPNYKGADHQAFLDYGYDGVWIVEHDGCKYCNTRYDNLTYINSSYLEKATKMICAILIEMANKPIDVQVILRTPYEGKGYFFNNPLIPLDLGKYFFQGFRGTTFILGRAIASCEVISKEVVKNVVFCIDDDFMLWDSNSPYEWNIRGKFFPLIGKYTLKVVAYTASGKFAVDEMDIYIITLSSQYS